MTFIGSLTAFFAASTGLTQNDIKKIIAYSTCSQLGYMFMACGLGQFSVSFFHLINHAFFKALLFLAAGCVIHAFNGQQDIRYMGSSINFLPFTYSSFLIGSLSLMGFPFLTGFYSKDLIIETAFANYTVNSYFSFSLSLFTALLTAFYSIRLLYHAFIAKPFSYNSPLRSISQSSSTLSNQSLSTFGSFATMESSLTGMSLPLFILSFFSIFFGYMAKDLFVGLGTPIFSAPSNFDCEFLEPLVRLYPLFASMTGIILAFSIYPINYPLSFANTLYYFFNGKWFFDTINSIIVTNYFLIFSYLIPLKSFDRGLISYFGPTGLSRSASALWSVMSINYQSGEIRNYVFAIFTVITSLFLILYLSFTLSSFDTSFKIISLIAPFLIARVTGETK